MKYDLRLGIVCPTDAINKNVDVFEILIEYVLLQLIYQINKNMRCIEINKSLGGKKALIG